MHIEYIKGKIDNKQLVSKVKEFERRYDIKKQSYPIATKEELQSFLSFMTETKAGYFMARITTMFQLLQDYRSFTVGQLEFCYSVYDQDKMINTLQKLPIMLSKTAILKRMSNSGHFSSSLTKIEPINGALDLNRIFELSEKLGIKGTIHSSTLGFRRFFEILAFLRPDWDGKNDL